MQDLSNLFPDGPVAALVPSNQHSGNRPSDQSAAQSAQGSPSPSVDEGPGGVAGGDDVARPPFASAADHARSVITDGNEPPNPTPYTRDDDGSGWLGSGSVRMYPNRNGPDGTAAALRASNPARR